VKVLHVPGVPPLGLIINRALTPRKTPVPARALAPDTATAGAGVAPEDAGGVTLTASYLSRLLSHPGDFLRKCIDRARASGFVVSELSNSSRLLTIATLLIAPKTTR